LVDRERLDMLGNEAVTRLLPVAVREAAPIHGCLVIQVHGDVDNARAGRIDGEGGEQTWWRGERFPGGAGVGCVANGGEAAEG
jgi:hypothetical protein